MKSATDEHLPPERRLRQAGLRVTAPRLAVLAAFVHCPPHADAERIAAAVREGGAALSPQTVYNVLRAFAEAGLVRRIEPAGSPGLYELRAGDNHHHAICRRCGATADVDCAVGETPCLTAADDSGYQIDEAEITFWGLCPDCVAARSGSSGGTRRPRRGSNSVTDPWRKGVEGEERGAMSRYQEAAREEDRRV